MQGCGWRLTQRFLEMKVYNLLSNVLLLLRVQDTSISILLAETLIFAVDTGLSAIYI